MWTVIYVAPSKQIAEQLKQALESEGILVSLRTAGLSNSTGSAQVELMVPQGEAREAHEVLSDALGRARYKK